MSPAAVKSHRHTFVGGICSKCEKRKSPQGRPSSRPPTGANRSSAPPTTRPLSAASRVSSTRSGRTLAASESRWGARADDFDDRSDGGNGDDDDDGLAAALGRVHEPAVSGVQAADDEKPAPSWCGFAGSLIGDGMVVLCRALVRRTGTEPGAFVDPSKKARLDDALGRQLALWFPDAELPPWGEALMITAAIAGGLKATGHPLPPKPSAATADQPASHAATAGETNGSST